MIRCPECGVTFDPREAQVDEEWREIINLLPTFGAYGRLVFEYVEKFGVNPLRIKSKKILRILTEMSNLFEHGKFNYQKRTHAITVAGIVEALKVVNNKHFDQPLENHNYLKKVMLTTSEAERKEQSAQGERNLRKKEALLMSGVRPPEDGETISGPEFKRRKGIESLAGSIGKEV